MLGYLLIIVRTLFHLAESVLIRGYAKKNGSGGMLMNAIIALFSTLFFLITDKGGFYAPSEMIPLAVITACLYVAGFYFTFLAYQHGPYGLTRLISSFSLLFTIFYGIFFLNENPAVTTYVGIAAIIVAMLLINYSKSGDSEKGVSLKWFVYIMISLFANGFISILMRTQQIRFNDTCSNEFQIISISGSFVLLTILGIVLDRDKLPYIIRHGVPYGIGAGICNGAKNFVTLIIYTLLPLTVISPMATGLGMLSTFLMALLVYKEKYTRRQLVGVVLGVAAVILLAIK